MHKPHGSSVKWRFELSNVIEIRNEIIFDIYTGLQHMNMYNMSYHSKTSCMKIVARSTQSSCIKKLATFFTYTMHGLISSTLLVSFKGFTS